MKRTQCAMLAEEFGFYHISVGNVLREKAARPESLYQDFIIESTKRSILLPAQLTTELLRQAISNAHSQGRPMFLLNSFPRNVAEAVDFESKVRSSNKS
jgi:adenylate kinase family enzyme